MKIYKSWIDELKAEFKTELKRVKNVDLSRTLPAVLSRKECNKLMNFYQNGKKYDERNYLAIRILYATGIRIGELSNIRFCDFNYDNQTIFIRQGKGKKDRYVIIDKDSLKLINKFKKKKNKILSDKLFNVEKRQLQNIVERAGDKTGISEKYDGMNRRFSAHSLRHAFATHSFENGMRIFILKKILGHEYLGTTEIYVNTASVLNLKEYNKTNPINPKKR